MRPLHRHRRTRQVHLQVQQQSEVTIGHQETDAIHLKPRTKIRQRDNNRASENRLRDLMEWLEEFTDISKTEVPALSKTEVPAPAHISHDSDLERLTKVACRKHLFLTHFPRDRNCEVCLRTKMTRAPCRKRRRSSTSSRKVW